MLDGGNTGADRVQDTETALGVTGGALVETLALGHTGGHFLRREMRVFRADTRRHHAAGRHQLDQVGAGIDLLAHGLDHLVRPVRDTAVAVTVSTGHADDLAGTEYARSDLGAAVAGIAHRQLQIILAATIAQRGDAAHQRGLRVLVGRHGDLARRHHRLDRDRVAFAAHAEMHVTIDQPRKQRAASEVDAKSCETLKPVAWRHLGNPAVAHHHAVIFEAGAVSVENCAALIEGFSDHDLSSPGSFQPAH